MRKRLLTAALLALAGCGDPSPQERLQGIWAVTLSSGCLYGATFTDADVYELDLICELQNGNLGMQIELGNYDAGDKKIDFTPTKASCPGDAMAFSGNYTVDGDKLTFLGPGGAVVLAKQPRAPAGMGAVAQFGCWNEDDTFTPGTLKKL